MVGAERSHEVGFGRAAYAGDLGVVGLRDLYGVGADSPGCPDDQDLLSGFDAAEATFEVDRYEDYLKVQCESGLRNLAAAFPYDAHQEDQRSLRANAAEIAAQLKVEIEERVTKAGLDIVESRISHLAYSPEIATAMLQRQQASAIIAARSKIVEGAVGMVEMALDLLSKKGIVELDSERKAAMVSNLLVVLCGERSTQPVVNTGTIYH